MLPDFLFPRRCLGCRKWGNYFCPACCPLILPLEKQICPVCQKPSGSGQTHPRCQTKYSLNGLISVFPYQGMIKEAIKKLKYRFVTDLAEELIDLVVISLPPLFPKKAFLLPVPLHPKRQRWRGFNQAELLGEMLAKKKGWPIRSHLLSRIKYTSPQVKLKGKARQKNIKGVFEPQPKARLGSKLILFDDVWTTGSTLKEAARMLKRRKSKEVWGLTLAR